MSLFERINSKLIREKQETKKEILSDKEKYYKDRIDKKAKELGYKDSSELEKSVDRGIKAVDKKPGGRLPKVGYATGEPFQPDNNPATVKYKKDKKGFPIKVPGTGKFPASGKSTLRGRFRYPSMDKDFSAAVKSGEVERDVAKRLATRLGYTAKDELGDINTPEGKKNIDNFVKKVMKNQKGTIGTGKGKDSDLYKILKRDIDNRNPTVPSKVINPKTGKPFRNPMPGGFDADGGRTDFDPKNPDKPKKSTPAQQTKYDRTAQNRAAKFNKEIAKQANLPKNLTIPKGGSGDSTPLSKKELNVKYKAAKMKLDYGGRFAQRDGLTPIQRKKKLKDLKRQLDLKNPTITSPRSGGQIPATAANLKKYGYTKTNFKRTPKINFQSFRDISKKFKKVKTPKLGIMKNLNKLPKGSPAKVIGTAAFVTAASLLSRPRNKTKTKTKINNANITPPPNTGSKKFLGIEKSPPIIFNLGGPGGKNPGGNIDFKPYGTK